LLVAARLKGDCTTTSSRRWQHSRYSIGELHRGSGKGSEAMLGQIHTACTDASEIVRIGTCLKQKMCESRTRDGQGVVDDVKIGFHFWGRWCESREASSDIKHGLPVFFFQG
jgi:hypothetical protein